MVERIDVNRYGLSGPHMQELCFFEVGRNPNIAGFRNRHKLLS